MSAPDTEGIDGFGPMIVVYVLVFILLYAGVNSLVVLGLGGLLGLGRPVLYTWIAVVTLSLPVSVYVERVYPNSLSRLFYTASTLWMGVLLFLGCSLLIYEVVSVFSPIPYAGPIIVIVVGVLSIISVRNATGIEVTEIDVPVEGLPEDISIVQLSDLHLGTIRDSEYLATVVERATRLDPDIVLITGDMVDANARLHTEMFDEFDRFGTPVYFVTGNHEVYEGLDEVYSLFDETQIRVLRNEVVDYDDIQIVGVEYAETDGHLGTELENLELDEAKPAVLMYHSPEGVEDSERAGIDLQLAGHTHAGQVFPFNFLVRIMFPYITGLYDLGGMFLYVSPGTGTWGPYMRLGSRNEITRITLKAK